MKRCTTFDVSTVNFIFVFEEADKEVVDNEIVKGGDSGHWVQRKR